jgi:hypothetical protein
MPVVRDTVTLKERSIIYYTHRYYVWHVWCCAVAVEVGPASGTIWPFRQPRAAGSDVFGLHRRITASPVPVLVTSAGPEWWGPRTLLRIQDISMYSTVHLKVAVAAVSGSMQRHIDLMRYKAYASGQQRRCIAIVYAL